MNKINKKALTGSIATAAYIILVVLFMQYMQVYAPKPDNVLVPIAMLLLFVFSAAFVGVLIFGKPVMMYLDGKKKEAVLLLGYTLVILLIITLMTFVLLWIYFSLIFI